MKLKLLRKMINQGRNSKGKFGITDLLKPVSTSDPVYVNSYSNRFA
jgi:hypothetical protein